MGWSVDSGAYRNLIGHLSSSVVFGVIDPVGHRCCWGRCGVLSNAPVVGCSRCGLVRLPPFGASPGCGSCGGELVYVGVAPGAVR